MSTEIRGRPVLRPAGNVALRHESKEKRGAHARKSTKKPPPSPPLKPTPATLVKISPPNSQPGTPRSPLTKSPLLKPSSASKLPPSLSPKKPSSSVATSKACPPFLLHQVSLDFLSSQDRSGIADDSPVHDGTPQNLAPVCEVGLPLHETVSVTLASDELANVGAIANLLNHAPSAEPLLDHVSPEDAQAFGALLSSELIYDLELVDDELIFEAHSPAQLGACTALCKIGSVEPAITVTESSSGETSSRPIKALAKPKPRFTRSFSENFHRGSAHDRMVSSSSSRTLNSIGSHSLDDTSIAHIVAAKKAAALELSVQRKLKVAEYGRKPGKASRVAPEVASLLPVIADPARCKFITAQSDPLLVAYHDQEWGVPLHDDRGLFELLVLAGAQAELSWTTLLHRRDTYRDVFCGYDPACVAAFSEKHIQSLEADKALPGGKIRGVVENARRILQIVKEFGSLDNYLWSFLNNKPMINSHRYPTQVPMKTSKSEYISKCLVRKGFRSVGPTIFYSFMQAAGMTNDHLVQCFRHQACMALPISSKEGELEHCLVVGCDTTLAHTDADQANPEQQLLQT